LKHRRPVVQIRLQAFSQIYMAEQAHSTLRGVHFHGKPLKALNNFRSSGDHTLGNPSASQGLPRKTKLWVANSSPFVSKTAWDSYKIREQSQSWRLAPITDADVPSLLKLQKAAYGPTRSWNTTIPSSTTATDTSRQQALAIRIVSMLSAKLVLVAQLDRVSHYGCEGSRFEPWQA
jgi:ribosomal protein S10